MPHVHEGEADGAAEQLEDEARGQGGDDGEVDVAKQEKVVNNSTCPMLAVLPPYSRMNS